MRLCSRIDFDQRAAALKRLLLSILCPLMLVVGLLAAGAATTAARTSARSASACSGPVVHDPYDGFHVGVPAGWEVTTGDGLILVHNTANTSQSVVSPAILTKGLTPARFFAVTANEISALAAAAGNRLSFHVTSANGGLDQATVTGRGGNLALSGRASVSVIPDPTAHGSQMVVFTAYWAPPNRLAAERSELVAIGACYGPQPAALFRIVRDQAFTYPIPPGWTVPSSGPNAEGANNLTMYAGPDASANYVFLEAVTASEGVTDARSLLTFSMGRLGISIDTVLSLQTSAPMATANGGTQESVRVEFLGKTGGTQIHVVATVTSDTVGSVTSGALRFALATPAVWNSLNGALIQVANGIEHDFTQDLEQLQQIQQQLDMFDQQVAGFDYALTGTDLVENPATGQQFEAPYAAYDPNGPDGPGYYSGSQRLQIVTPS